MKKISKIILTAFITTLFSITGTKAVTIKKEDTFTKINSFKIEEDGLTYATNKYHLFGYDFRNASTSTDYPAYCLDPHKYAAGNYKVGRILGDTTQSRFVQSYDAGIKEILKYGNNRDNKGLTFTIAGTNTSLTLNSDELYVATSIAVRSFTEGLYGWGSEATLKNKYGKEMQSAKDLASAHANLGIDWAALFPDYANKALNLKCDAANFASCYRSIIKSASGYDWYKEDATFVWNYGDANSSSYKIIYGAQELYRRGLLKAAEVRENGTDTPSVSLKINNKLDPIQSATNDRETRGYIYAFLNFENFKGNDAFINNINYSCDNCSRNTAMINKMEFYNPTTSSWETLNGRINILTAFNAKDGVKSGQLRIRLDVTRVNDEEYCQPVGFSISYDYYDSSLDYVGAILYAYDPSKENEESQLKAQRFVVISKVTDGAGNNNVSDSAVGNIPCTTTNAHCETEIQVPVCSDDEAKSTARVYAPKNIKKCILFNKDDAGNDYQLSARNGGVSNDYCSVFCKEDYDEIKLNPIVDDVVCGGYFKLKSHVEGKKDCYTGGTGTDRKINKQNYLEDIKEAQEDMVDAMNRYYKYSAMLNNHTTKTTSTRKTCGGSSCGSRDTITATWGSYTKIAFKWNNWSQNGDFEETTESGSNTSWSDSCSCDTCGTAPNTHSCCGGCDNGASEGYTSWKSQLHLNIATAKKDLEDALSDYEKYITNYNACTTGWTNEYQFAQRIKYYYNEYQNRNPYETYYGLLDYLKEDAYYLESVKKNDLVDSKITVCLGDITDDYSCIGNNYIRLDGNVDGKNSNNKSDNYNSAYKNGTKEVFEEKTYTICTTTDGCKTEKRHISKATYVKKTVEKEQDYITPTVFYQIAANGRITVDSGYVGSKWRLQELVNGLPVSLRSSGGGSFKLQLEDFGEFYTTGELGRIFDFDGNNEDKSIAGKKGTTSKFDGNYQCYYNNLCECPDCETPDTPWTLCPDCPPTKTKYCLNCIISGDLQLNFRPISSTNFNSANRPFGYNWLTKDDLKKYNWITNTEVGQLKLLTEKAEETIKEITENNETIYIDPDKNTDSSSFGYSIRLTREVINKIKEYNKEHEKEGGYANDSLYCYDAEIGGKTYKNLYCYSELLDDLADDGFGKFQEGRENNTNLRANVDYANSGYWTPWYKMNLKENEKVLGGPAWK